MSIPTTKEKLTPKQTRKKLRDQFYAMNVSLNNSANKMFSEVDADSMTEVFGAYMAIATNTESGDEDVQVDPKTMQQMALLAAQALSRHLVERYK